MGKGVKKKFTKKKFSSGNGEKLGSGTIVLVFVVVQSEMSTVVR